MINFTNLDRQNLRQYGRADEAGEPAIECRSVSCRRPGSTVRTLNGLSLTVRRGEWVCLAGRNGSGKSTLIRLIAGLLNADEGEIRIDGEPLDPRSIPRIRGKIGMLFSEPDDQFVGLTVADDIAFGLENIGLSREEMEARISRYAELLGIGHLLDRHPAAMSGGQKQLAAMAAVLAMEPSILLLDEAGSMLDDRARTHFRAIVNRLRSTGTYTIVSVTHDAEEMLLADRLVLVSEGRVLAEGEPERLLADEHLLAKCRISPPFALAFCRELARHGWPIGLHADERKAVDALWASLLSKSPPGFGTEIG